jgi:hypothetical protein
MAANLVEQAAPAVEDVPADPAEPDRQALSTDTPTGTGALQVTDPRIAFLVNLVAERHDAIAQALRAHRVVVHLPKVVKPKVPKAKAEGSATPGKRTKLSLEIARDIRRRITEAKAAGAGKGIENVIASELQVHYTTIADVRDGKIWREPVAERA